MNIGWLQDFLTAAESGSFTRAAMMRNSSQAAFSRRIMALEAWLGAKVFDRSAFPMRLTPQGERLREKAAEIVQNVADAKVIAAGDRAVGRDLLRIGIPHVLATTRLARWTDEWSQNVDLSYEITTGSVHDNVTALVAGSIDVLIAFTNPQQPVYLSAEQFDRIIMAEEVIRPYASLSYLEKASAAWPGTRRHPVQLLSYSPGVYLGRMVDLIIENAPETLYCSRWFESDLSDVLRSMTISGHGVAFLPDCAVDYLPNDVLVPVGGDQWSLTMSVVAYMARTNKRSAVQRMAHCLAQTV